jgi:hypothetical protein
MKPKFMLSFLLLLQIIALQIVSFFPEFVEQYYSNGLYGWISNFSRSTLGAIFFSVGDLLYIVVLFLIAKWFWTQRKSWKTQWQSNSLRILSFISVLCFVFHLLWGMNYHRVPLVEKMNIKKDYSDADLLLFTQKLIAKTNAVHHQIVKNDRLKVVFPYTQEQVFDFNSKGYEMLSKEYPLFTYQNPSVKKSLMSLPLTYMGFGGYLNPFTNEAQVNYLGPMYNFPTTTCHEMAHQLGYASESEANFIGFLASVKNDNLYFQYSGYSQALRNCLRNWQIRDQNVLKTLVKTIHPGILANFKESETFWTSYETFIETGFKLFYDHFLKFNQQEDGLESYSKYVDLMVNYYKDKAL